MGCGSSRPALPKEIRELKALKDKATTVKKLVQNGELDPRLPLTERQLFAIHRAWKSISRNMSTVAVNMFVRYVHGAFENFPFLSFVTFLLWQKKNYLEMNLCRIV